MKIKIKREWTCERCGEKITISSPELSEGTVVKYKALKEVIERKLKILVGEHIIDNHY